MLEVLCRPTLPEVCHYSLAHVPSTMERWFGLDRELRICTKFAVDQEMTRSESADSIGGVTGDGYEWPTVQAGLDLSSYGAELFVSHLLSPDDSL